MTPHRWQQIDAILDTVLDATPSERPALIRRLCAEDFELEHEVLALLRSTETDSRFIKEPFHQMVQAFDGVIAPPLVGQFIGAYKIVREIGRGGMAIVYLAERADGSYQHQVAIKMVGSQYLLAHTATLMQRFRQERQILASLDHPNISRLLDGGTTATGIPYVVMEYVEGVPLLQYCEQQQLSLNKRLRLFQKVCEAVQFAHQKLIIHRDLKPGNVLVNREGTVKLLDFGIAKLLPPELSLSQAEATLTLQILTPAYASPEQLRGEAVSAATDVYALGLILYELLTAQRAYQIENLSLTEIIRVVCEDIPPRPSTVVRGTQAENSSSQSEKLSASLVGDLDTILLTALAKAPEQRYASVAEFSADLERYLTGLPIQARPATYFYRARKFLGRNKKGGVVAALLCLSILAGIFSTRRQAQIAQDLAQARRRTIYDTQMNLAAHAWETSNLARLRELLVGHFPASGEEDLRQFEWYYLWQRLHNNGQQLSLPHPKGVIAATYSPDGSLVATACEDHLIRLWAAATGQFIAKLSGHTDYVNHLSFSHDGNKLISSCSDQTAKIWDIPERKELLTLKGHQAKVNRATFTPDDRSIITCADDGTWKKWDAHTGQEIFTVQGPGQLIRALAISPDGRMVATGGLVETVNLWDARTGKPIPFLADREKWQSWSIAFSTDGKMIAAGGTHSKVKIWQITTRREVAQLSTDALQVHEVAFSPDGKTLATSSDKGITTLWNIAAQKPLAQVKGHTQDIFSVAFAPDGQKLLSASLDNTARIWNLGEIVSNSDQDEAPAQYSTLAYAPNQTQILQGNDYGPFILSEPDGKQARSVFTNHKGYMTKIVFSPDGDQLAAGCVDSHVTVWNQKTNAEEFSCVGHTAEITALRYATNGKMLFTGSRDQTLRAWDAQTGKNVFTSPKLSSFINEIAISADNSLLATASYDAQVFLWDIRTWQIVKVLTGYTRPVSIMAFSTGNLFATGSEDDAIKIWKLPLGNEMATIQGLLGHLTALTFSPDGKRLAVATSDGYVSLWDPFSSTEVFSGRRHQQMIFHLGFSQNGETLFSGDRSGVRRRWHTAAPRDVNAPTH